MSDTHTLSGVAALLVDNFRKMEVAEFSHFVDRDEALVSFVIRALANKENGWASEVVAHLNDAHKPQQLPCSRCGGSGWIWVADTYIDDSGATIDTGHEQHRQCPSCNPKIDPYAADRYTGEDYREEWN